MPKIRLYCDLCGWKTPGLTVHVRLWDNDKKKTVRCTVGYMCKLCGKIHAQVFPTLYLLTDDAEKVKNGERRIIDYQPQIIGIEKWTEIDYDKYLLS